MDLLKSLNWIDVIVVIILIRISYVAFNNGFYQGFISLIGIVLNIAVSLHYYAALSEFISSNVSPLPGVLLDVTAFLGITIAMGLLVRIMRAFFSMVAKVELHSTIDKIGGIFVGIFQASLTVSLVLIILMLLPLPYLQHSVRDRSVTGMFFVRLGPMVHEHVSKILPSIGEYSYPQSAEKLNAILAVEKTINLFDSTKMKRDPFPEE